MRFGLEITEPHTAYMGWRAIYTGRLVDIPPDRGSDSGDPEALKRLIAWVNNRTNTKKGGRRRSPWQRLLKAAEEDLNPQSSEGFEIREGRFVLRANPLSSYGYLYIALFELKEDE